MPSSVPNISVNAPLKIEKVKSRPPEVPSYSSDSPLNYETAIAKQRSRDKTLERNNALFWMGTAVTLGIFIVSIAVYFLLLRLT